MKKSFENYNNIRIKIGREEKAKPAQMKCDAAATDDPYNFEFSSKKDLISKRLIFKARSETRVAPPPKPTVPILAAPLNSVTVFNVKRKFNKPKIGKDSDDSESSSDEKNKRFKAKVLPSSLKKKEQSLDEAICFDSEANMSEASCADEKIPVKTEAVHAKEEKAEVSTDEESGRLEPISVGSVKVEKKREEPVKAKETIAMSNVSVEVEVKVDKVKVEKSKEKMFDSEDSESESREQRVRLKLKSRSWLDGVEEKRVAPLLKSSSVSDSSTALNAGKAKTSRRKIFNFKKNHDDCKQVLNFNFNPHEETKEDLFEEAENSNEEKESTKKSKSVKHAEYDLSSAVRTIELDIHLRNSRKAYECEELGETQAFLDDIYYFVDGLNARKYRLCDRCLCAVKLAEKCLSSEFRLNLRTSSEYIRKIFSLLKDSTKFQSLALCTSLIMFALTQDKLMLALDEDTFGLIVAIINMRMSELDENAADDENDDEQLFRKIFARCRQLCHKLLSQPSVKDNCGEIFLPTDKLKEISGNLNFKNNNANFDVTISEFLDNLQLRSGDESIAGSGESGESGENEFGIENFFFNFNAQLLAMECLLNLNLKNQHQDQFEVYKRQLRELGVLDKILHILSLVLKVLRHLSKSADKEIYLFFMNKYQRYLSFIECLWQSEKAEKASNQPKRKAIKSSQPSHPNNEFFKSNLIFDLIKDSLRYFYQEISENCNESLKYRLELAVSSVRTNFLLMMNLTYYNENVCKRIANNEQLVDLIFVCVTEVSRRLDKDEQFDLLIMSMSVLFNIYDAHFGQKDSVLRVRRVAGLDLTTYQLILNLYLEKEKLVSVAEDDQENEFSHLAEQIQSQNADTVNKAIMSSIHKAGKHMEDHLVAACSALLLGHMLVDPSNAHLISLDEEKSKMRDNSFKYMAQIIRKFLVFMKMMNVKGFAADESVFEIIKFLEEL